MTSTIIPIAVLAAASLAAAQTPMPVVRALAPSSPVLIQITPGSMFAAEQAVAASQSGQTGTSSTSVTSSDGRTVTTSSSSGRKTVSISSGAQGKDQLFAGTEKFAQGASESTEINLDPDTMGMVGSKHKNGDLAKKMKTMVIRSYTYDKPGMYKLDDIEVYRKKLEDGSWKCSVRVREKNESTDICSRLAADHEMREMVIITAEPKELTFIHMTGQMSLDELGDAAHGLQKR